MNRRLVGALAGLMCSAFSNAGSINAEAADLSNGNGTVLPRMRVDRVEGPVCVEENGPDAPPYGYGCLDHWVLVRNTQEVIQDNGYGYTVTTETVRRRYPPQAYVLQQEGLNLYANGYTASGQRLFPCRYCE